MRVDMRCAQLVKTASVAILLIAGLSACGGNSTGSLELQPSHPQPTAARVTAFTLNEPGPDQTAGLGLSVSEQGSQAMVSVIAEQLLSPDAVLFEVNYDPARYTPQVVQATDAYCVPADSLTLEMLETPGLVSFGQVPVGTIGNVVEPGAVLAEVLFSAEPLATRAAAAVPVHSGALCPLTYDGDTGELTLHYVNPGDYDQNGTVSASDLVPIGRHYSTAGPFAFETALSVVDGNNNGQIDVADITVIGQYWGNDVEQFNFYGSNNIDDVPLGYAEPSRITPLGSVAFQAATGTMPAVPINPVTDRLCFSFTRDTLDYYEIYWARPGAEGTEGICSNLAGPTLLTQLGSQSNALPAAQLSLSYTGLEAPATVTLDASGSSDLDGVIAFYEWDFEGDGLYDAFGAEPVVTHVYNQGGTFAPLVRVTDNLGAWAIAQADPFTVTEILQPNIPPIADIVATVTSGTAPLIVGFIASGSSDSDGNIASYEWDFDGDGTYDLNSGLDPTVIHEYALGEDKFATVRVTDDRGGTATDSVLISVAWPPYPNDSPEARLTTSPQNGFVPFSVRLDAGNSVDAEGPLALYEWDFDGDGSFEQYGSTDHVDHIYHYPGSFNPTVRVTDSEGATDTYAVFLRANVPLDEVEGWPSIGRDLHNTGRTPHYGPTASDVLWSYRTTGAGFEMSDAVAGADGTLYFSCGPELTAMNPDGTVKWQSATCWPTTKPVLVGDGTIYLGNDYGMLCAFNPDGSTKWTAHAGVVTSLPPVVAPDGTIYLITNGLLFAANPDGSTKWSKPVGSVYSAPAVSASGILYYPTTSGVLFAINPDGSQQWIFYENGAGLYSPAVGADGTIYTGSADRHLYAVNPDGSLQWSFSTAGAVQTKPVLAADGTIYATSSQGTIYALKADGSLEWSDTVPGSSYASPVIAPSGEIVVHSNSPSLTAYNADGTVAWDCPLSTNTRSQPVIDAAGIVYIAVGRRFEAIDPSSGPIWSFANGGYLYHPAVIDTNGRAVFGCRDGNIYAINPDGSVDWTYPAVANTAAAIGPNGSVHLWVNDGELLALDRDGHLLWSYSIGDVSSLYLGDPVADHDGTVYAFGESRLYAFSPDGSEKWAYSATHSDSTAPSINDDGTIYFCAHSLYAINPDGTEKWVLPQYSSASAPVIGDDGSLYLASGSGKVYSVNPDGTVRWTYDTGMNMLKGCSIGHDGAIYVSSHYHKLLALSADGSFMWDYDTAQGLASPAVIDGDGRIYFGDTGGRVYCLDDTGNELWAYDTGGWAARPAIRDDGVLIVGSYDGYLYAFGP